MGPNRIYILTLLLVMSGFLANAQKLLTGMVVDSASLDNLQGVHVRIKNSQRGAITDAKGIFILMVNQQDSLIFSYIGYAKITLPVYLDEEIMFVKMHQVSVLLNEITFREQAPLHTIIYSPTLNETKPLEAAGIDFSRFAKAEKEKRKLVGVIREMDQARIYVNIVTDPALKEEIMKTYSISEDKFYELLATFNENNRDVMYSANANIILYSLRTYFDNSLKKK